MRFLLLILGILGLLLCLGSFVGTFWAKGKVGGGVDSGHEAVDGVLDSVQEAVGEALPRIKAARKHILVKTAEMTMPELAHLRARLEGVARAGEAAAGVLEALGHDGVKLAELRARTGELRAAARDLVDQPAKRAPALEVADTQLEAIHGSLSDLRLGAADLRNRIERLVGIATLVLAGFLAWMGIGQLCMIRIGSPRGDD
ncbi:MAG: hypothetical protein ABFS86_06785 [Planctomycetota bacterium]